MHDTEILSAKVNAMADTIDRMSRSMEKISESMDRLVRAEERISHVVEMNAKMQDQLDDLKEEINNMKITVAGSQRTSGIVDKFLWALAAATLIFVAAKTGLLT